MGVKHQLTSSSSSSSSCVCVARGGGRSVGGAGPEGYLVFISFVFVRCEKIDNNNFTPDEDFLSKALVFNCSLYFVVYVSTFP